MSKCMLILSLIMIAGCIEEPKTAVNYYNLKNRPEIERAASTVILEEPPIEIGSTECLIYVIEEPENLCYGKMYSSCSSSTGDTNFSVIN